jgi:hypothetical protein
MYQGKKTCMPQVPTSPQFLFRDSMVCTPPQTLNA